MSADLWLSLLCAMIYATGALMTKRASVLGIGPWTTTLTSNLTAAVSFMFLWPLGGEVPSLIQLYQPAFVAILFIAGQAFVFQAFQKGDVSVATPILGVKIVLVALFTVWLQDQHLDWQVWLGAILACLAVMLINRSDRTSKSRFGLTVVLASSSALSFALFDVLVQKWGPAWGVGTFNPIMMLFVAAFSLAAHPFLGGGRVFIGGESGRWLWWGNVFIALQCVIFVTAILYYQNATSMNVIFSSRGLWSVVFVWLFGAWFQSAEQHRGAHVLRWRLIGAIVMMAAIALVVLKP